MLEKESVGQRSGVSPVRSSVRSQKKAKVRCSTVSSSAWTRGVGGKGAVVATEPLHATMAPRSRLNDVARRLAGAVMVGSPRQWDRRGGPDPGARGGWG